MMDKWRGQKAENDQQEIQKSRSYNRRPPLSSWQASVPSWEKKFCSSIGSIPWRKLLEIKKYMHLYDNVVQWDDSAGEEAFNNAKYRFWAEMNGLRCNISLPGADIYIDEIDWNPEIEPELILDLERDPVATYLDEEVSINGSSLLLNQPVPCTGWGDEEEDQGKATNSFSGFANCDRNANNNDYPWESSCPQSNKTLNGNGCGNCWNDSWELNKWENNFCDSENIDGGRTNGVWETCDRNLRNGAVDGWHMSRYKTSSFHDDDYQIDHGLRNQKWKKTFNNVYKVRKPTSRQWKMMNTCQPLNNGSGRTQNSWNWEKPVL